MNGYNRALRQFFKWVSDEPQYDTYEWVDNVEDYDTDNGNSKRLKAEEYLTGEEVTALIEAATHPREEALIEFLADTGARINVVTNLRRQDIDIDGSRPTYRPNPNAQDGYKGIQIKRYPIHYSERPLSIWLNRNHPDKHPDAPAFPVKIGYDKSDRENMAMHPQTAFDTLRGLAEEAGIDESRVHPHAFRHAAVRRMKTDPDFNFDWETVKLRTAWSDRAFESMKELYGALEESEQLDYFFNRAGRETGDGDTGEPEFRECPTCGEMNRRTATYCQQCGKSLDAKLKEAEDKKEEIDDPKVRGIVDALIEEAKNNPEKFT